MTHDPTPTLVTDAGFGPETWPHGFTPSRREIGGDHGAGLDLAPDADLLPLAGTLTDVAMIRIAFPSFADGRGFTLARRLRLMGYRGRLRAAGHVLADQYTMARRAGFDEVEIDAALATRQPEPHWRFRSDWVAHDYQSRLRATT